MYRLRRILFLTVLAAAAPARAADHADGPQASAPANLDIADLYAWKNTAGNLVVAMTVNGLTPAGEAPPLAVADEGRYLFHIDTNDDYADGATIVLRVVCASGTPQRCTLYGIPNGRALTTRAGQTTSAGRSRFWFGIADDPFVFNLTDFSRGKNQCFGLGVPQRDCATAFTEAFAAPNADTFAGTNVTAIVAELPMPALASGAASLRIWAETERREE